MPQAFYFPVSEGPYAMRPGLYRFGRDFGNGSGDAQYFQADELLSVYAGQKRDVLTREPQRFGWIEEPGVRHQLERVYCWMTERLEREQHPAMRLTHREDSVIALDEQSRALAEDWALLEVSEGGVISDRVIAHHICFPSGFRPQHLLGRSFAEVHRPVPLFDGVSRVQSTLVKAMASKGPFVRFVWSVCPDGPFDRCPGATEPDHSERYVLRVERQVTVPFVKTAQLSSACLFIIRVYHYPLDRLSQKQKALLAGALREMPPAIRVYKGLDAMSLEQLGLSDCQG